MEIAPKGVVSLLYENLRSWDQRAVLKFSLYPFVDFYTEVEKQSRAAKGPIEGQDFLAISLTNKFANQKHGFPIKIAELECKKRGIGIHDLADYLNRSSAIHKGTREFDGLKVERNFAKIFSRPYEKNTDKSFEEYVKSKGHDGWKGLLKTKKNERASTTRKVAPICEFRNYYLTNRRAAKRKNKNLPGRRSIQSFGYFHGFNQMLMLTESNPRTLKHYLNDLISALLSGQKSSTAQNIVIGKNIDRARAMIASQIVKREPVGELSNPLNLIDEIGERLSNKLLGGKFQPEPALSVQFKDMNPQQKRIIEVAIISGALIADFTNKSEVLLFDIEGIRTRISHSLAPSFPMPTITGRKITFTKEIDFHILENRPDLLSWKNL